MEKRFAASVTNDKVTKFYVKGEELNPAYISESEGRFYVCAHEFQVRGYIEPGNDGSDIVVVCSFDNMAEALERGRMLTGEYLGLAPDRLEWMEIVW